MSVTITDIARHLGLSPATVSCVLNGKGQRFSARTVARVLATASDLGYRPNASARAMRSGRFGSFVLLLGSDRTRSHLPTPLLSGIIDGMAEEELGLGLTTVPEGVLTDSAAVPRLLRELSCDGLLINCHKAFPEAVAAVIDDGRLPHVWINTRQRGLEVCPADRLGGHQAGSLLTALGHRRIGWIQLYETANVDHHFSIDERELGLREAVIGAGGSLTVLGNPGGRRFLDWPPVLAGLLASPERPTALVCYTPQMAAQALATALRLGLRVPEDLSLLSFSDEPPFFANLPVDVIQVPWYQLGRDAVALLARAVDGGGTGPGSEHPFVVHRVGTCDVPP